MLTKQEAIRTLTALTVDYSELISQCEQANELYFSESVPQPTSFQKSDETSVYSDDCEKIAAGKYTLNGENVNKAKSTGDCIDFTYQENQEQIEIKKPVERKPTRPVQPMKPTMDSIYDERPFLNYLLAIVSAITLGLTIASIVMWIVSMSPNVESHINWMFVLLISGVAAIISFVFSKGGFVVLLIRLIKNLAVLPSEKARYRRDIKSYPARMEAYKKEVAIAKEEYNKALQEYEQAVAAAAKEQAKSSKNLRETILADIKEYVEICKKYLARKKKVEQENDKQKAIIKTRYDAVVKKIQAYPDIIPPKFLKLPTFENASCYSLNNVRNELQAYVDIIESGRADTIKEATNCYVADQQAEEQRRILEEQAYAQRRQAEEQMRLLEEQAEEQRWREEERTRILQQQTDEQNRLLRQQAEEQSRISQQQTDSQNELLEFHKCQARVCPTCSHNGSVFCSYKSDGGGGCRHFAPYK